MLGYVHLLPETRPALERRTVAGTALWVLEGDLDGGLLPSRRLRRWTRRLAECGVSHAALPPGREGDFAPLRPVLPDGLRQLGLTTGGGPAAVTVTFGPPPREGLPLYLTPDCALRQEVRYAWPDPSQAPPPEGLLSLLHRACRLPEICVKSVETLDRSRENHYNAT